MHDRHNQFRGLVLAAIVVLSVVAGSTAFAGTVAATGPDGVDAADGWDSADQVGPGQTELVQYVTVFDEDNDSKATTIQSITVKGIGTADADDIASIDVYHDGTAVGSASPAAFNDQNVTIDLSPVTISDGEEATFSIYVTVSDDPTDDNTLRLESWVTVSEESEGTIGPVTDASSDKIDAEPPYMSGAISFVNDGVTIAGQSDTIVEVRFAEPMALTGSSVPVMSTGDFAVLMDDGSSVTPDAIYDHEGDSLSTNGSSVFLDLGDTNPNHVTAVRVTSSANFEDTEGNEIEPENTDDEPITTTSHTFSEGSAESERVFVGERVAFVADRDNDNIEIRTESGSLQFDGTTGMFSRVLPFDTSGLAEGTYHVTYQDGSSMASSHEDELQIRDLDLSVALNKPEITEREALRGTVSATDGNRQVEVRLFDNTGDEAASSRVSLDGSGEGDFAISGLDPGRYSLEAEDLETGLVTTVESIRVHQVTSGSGSSYSSAEAEFPQDRFTEDRGDIAVLNLNITGPSDYATLTIGSADADYHVEVDLREGDDDDVVTVAFDTYHPGMGADGTFAIPAGSDDEIESVTYVSGMGEDRVEPLAANEYDLSVTATYSSEDEQDTATLELTNRSTVGMTTWVAPAGAHLDNVSISDVATQRDTTAKGDIVAFQVEASGLGGLLGDAGYSIHDLTAANNTDGVSLAVSRLAADGNVTSDQIDVTNGSLVVDLETDQFFVVFDTAAADWNAGETYEAAFVMDETSPYVADSTDDVDSERVTSTLTLQNASTSFDGLNETGDLNLPPEEEAEVSGTATMAPGTNISVGLNSTDTFDLTDPNVTVQDDGTWSTTFNLSAYPEGTGFNVSATNADTRTGVVQVGPPEPEEPAGEPSFTLVDPTLSTTSVDVAEDFQVTGTVENDGDANGTYVAELVVGGSVATTQEVFVPAGESTEFTIDWELVTPGDHVVILDGHILGTVTVAEQEPVATTATPSEPAVSTPTAPTNSMLPLYGVGLVILIALGALLLGFRPGFPGNV